MRRWAEGGRKRWRRVGLAVGIALAVGSWGGPSTATEHETAPESTEEEPPDDTHPARDAIPLPIPQIEVTPEAAKRREELVAEPDVKQVDDPFTFPVFGRPLTISGSLETLVDFLGNPELDTVEDDRLRVRMEVELELYYQVSQVISIFLEGKYRHQWDVYREDGDDGSSGEFRRGQTFINADHMFDTPFGFRLGRQLFNDERSWWWSQNLDAVRLFYDDAPWYAEIAYLQEVAQSSTDDDFLDPDDDDVRRAMAHVSWEYRPDHNAELFAMYANDGSKTESVGDEIPENEEDDVDRNMAWVGLRTHGRWRVRKVGKFSYWLDAAIATGKEDDLEFDEIDSDTSVVESVTRRDVFGYAFDTGLVWETRWPCDPSFAIQYAFGSGDRGTGSGTDHSYRQTDLQVNKERWEGESRVSYYGRALNPELSNLHIVTVGVSFPFFDDSSIEFLYHYYHQVIASPVLRSEGLSYDPLGDDASLGNGFDAVLSLDEWEHLEIDLVASMFRAGAAFGPEEGTFLWRSILQVELAF